MRKLMYFVEVDRYRTMVYRIDLEEGKSLNPRALRGLFMEQAEGLLDMIRNKDYCTKIVFDDMGYGLGLKEYFIELIKEDRHIRMWSNGDIISPSEYEERQIEEKNKQMKLESEMTSWKWSDW